MRVFRPTDNPVTQGYSISHRGYDFSGLNRPDEVRSGANGVIIERVDEFDSNWRNTGTLTLKDYGNYIKVKHDDGTYALFAHLKQGSSFNIGTNVTAGQTIARIGNTGNSTGQHLHAEYRNALNVNESVDFYVNPQEEMTMISEAKLTQLREDRDKNWNMYQDQLKENEQLRKELAELNTHIESLKVTIESLKVKQKELEEYIKEIQQSNDTGANLPEPDTISPNQPIPNWLILLWEKLKKIF